MHAGVMFQQNQRHFELAVQAVPASMTDDMIAFYQRISASFQRS